MKPSDHLRHATAPQPRREVLELPRAVHGSLNFAELRDLGRPAEDILDFSANVNPYGPSPTVRAAVAQAPIDRYPDRASLVLRGALADSLGIAPARILAGNGASELIWLVALAFIRPGSRVLIVGPTYGEYARAAALMGASVATWRASQEADFIPDPAAIADRLESQRPEVLFLCNPNNPTGAVLPADVVAAWAGRFTQTLFVVDEAYQPFTAASRGMSDANPAGWPGAPGNVIVLRSLTKDFGLAGLRLGYAVADARTIALLERVQPPWSVNAPAQAAGVAALADAAHRQRCLDLLACAKDSLVTGLTELGLTPLPSATHFFVVRVGDGRALRAALLQRGVLVRDCASFGLPAYVRIATRRPDENQRLIAAVREVLR